MRNVKTERGTFPRVKEVYFLRLKEGETKKKTLGKMKVMEETISVGNKDNYGGSRCHISKEHYGAYEVVVLYN